MRKYLFLLLLTLNGCTSVPYTTTNFRLGDLKQASVGGEVIVVEKGRQTEGSKPVKQSAFLQELIYSGISNGVVYLLYREYSRDYTQNSFTVRPAFTHEFKYDLATLKDKIITFRDLRIRIEDATADRIVYVVIASGQGQNDTEARAVSWVTLRDGDKVYGELASYVEGEFVILKLPDGNIRKFEWNEIQEFKHVQK